jgi:iron complex outermembrane receptor protein
MFYVFMLGACLMAGSVQCVCAQEDDADEFTLEEITVTAQKREENQQKVAIAMEVISAETISELGQTSIDDILSNVSSVIVQKAADGLRVSIRGISDDQGTMNGQSMSAPSVAINTDGVYSNRKDTGSSLFDVERVEVLYGPQSTMYSSNSPGGIVNVVTAQPKTGKYSVNGSIEAGNYNLWNFQGAVNVPLGEKLAFRISGSKSQRDGYMESTSSDADTEDSTAGRFRVLYEINDKISITGTAELYKDESIGTGSGVEIFIHQDDDYYADGVTPLTNPWTKSSAGMDTPSTNDSNSEKYSLNLDWDMGFMTMGLIPSYSSGDAERTRVTVMDDSVDVTYSTTDRWEQGAELRFSSAADFFFTWILGFTYYDSEDTQDELSQDYVDSDGADGKFSFRTNTEENRAIFANVTVPITDPLRLTAGLRTSWDEMVTDNYERTWSLDNNDWEIRDENPTSNTNEGRPDIKVGFEYDLAGNSMLYGDYSTSYRVQGMSSSGDPQELKAYSLGAKNRFWDNKLQLNAAVYYYDYTNYSVNYRKEVWIADINGNNEMDSSGGAPDSPDYDPDAVSETENVSPDGVSGDGRMYGLDLSAVALITAKDIVNFSVSYIKSEWTDLFFDWTEDYYTVLNENGEAEVVPLEDTSYNGKPMQNTPEWTLNLSYYHNFSLWNGGNFKVGVSSKYQSAYRLSWNDDEYPYNYQEAFHMEDANATYSHPGGIWTLSAYVKNIFNYAEKRSYMNAGGNGSLTIGNPRTYGAVLSVKF